MLLRSVQITCNMFSCLCDLTVERCDPVPFVPRSVTNFRLATNGSTVNYTCQYGFAFQSTSTLSSQQMYSTSCDGQSWSLTPPACSGQYSQHNTVSLCWSVHILVNVMLVSMCDLSTHFPSASEWLILFRFYFEIPWFQCILEIEYPDVRCAMLKYLPEMSCWRE